MNTLELFDISTVSASSELVILTMPITDKAKQPYGILHGGISAMFAETAASIGANAALTEAGRVAVGVDLQIHHLNAATSGQLQAKATPLHIGNRIQTWQVAITEVNAAKDIAFATVTLASHSL
ncbi:PaaI family thioesterase [Weissella minor]|uniref:PaaI family thioesterase n=1 Tax=Weissella minor TaxID=1620 RepID=UPI001BAF01F9|nr:PaaI family thioesterase [Weissella minor]MBS0948849.1 PaaI family thioesterase [Weissella minor]